MGRDENEDDKRSGDDDRRRRKAKRYDDSDSSEEERQRKKSRKKHKRKKRRRDDDSSESDSSDIRERRKRERKKSRKHKKKRRKKHSSDSSSSASDNEGDRHATLGTFETPEEIEAREAEKRAAQISQKFGYTAEENPFNDPNLHESFSWKKRDAVKPAKDSKNCYDEIEKVRRRRKERDEQFQEMERIRAEESRMKELENYDDWARKEEEFHLEQQRQRSAIRLVEGREKPIDVLAKNIFMFGLSDDEKLSRSFVKYQERSNALDQIESLEVELEEPPAMLKQLKLKELEDLLVDIDAFRKLEGEVASGSFHGRVANSSNAVLNYWDNLRLIAIDEIKYLKSGAETGRHASMIKEVSSIFTGQTFKDLLDMRNDIDDKLRSKSNNTEEFDRNYWLFVKEQLLVHLAKAELSDLHSKMLVHQLERLEKKRGALGDNEMDDTKETDVEDQQKKPPPIPDNVDPEFGDLEEELGLSGEVDMQAKQYNWQGKYKPRKPRYFNRVKTGYDWNKYNQTHYDKDNPPPKTVQGYRFNIFYPDLVDPTKTPQFFLEAAESKEYCIIRFSAGPPYEDVAFKIINREWNRSRKKGFKCTFERGILSLYFNFTTFWYRN